MKKFVASILMVGFTSSLFAIGYEYPYIYKDPRVMGMGGAYTAVGGSALSVFYNPAGLSRIPREEGFEVNLLGVNAMVNQKLFSFMQDIQEASQVGDENNNGQVDDDRVRAINNVIAKYRGEELTFGVDTFLSIAKKGEKIGFALGGVGEVRTSLAMHQGFSSAGLITAEARTLYGGVFGLSYDLSNDLALGGGLKFLSAMSFSKSITSTELIDNQDDFGNYLLQEGLKQGQGFGLDLGALYRLPSILGTDSRVGVSLTNIPGIKAGGALDIPMSLNLGASFTKFRDSAFLRNITLAFDYVGFLIGNYPDPDIGKRIRMGTEVGLLKGRWGDLILRLGSYQGYLTAGAELRLLILRVVAATYGEEIGAYSGQHMSRRYVLSAFITW